MKKDVFMILVLCMYGIQDVSALIVNQHQGIHGIHGIHALNARRGWKPSRSALNAHRTALQQFLGGNGKQSRNIDPMQTLFEIGPDVKKLVQQKLLSIPMVLKMINVIPPLARRLIMSIYPYDLLMFAVFRLFYKKTLRNSHKMQGYLWKFFKLKKPYEYGNSILGFIEERSRLLYKLIGGNYIVKVLCLFFATLGFRIRADLPQLVSSVTYTIYAAHFADLFKSTYLQTFFPAITDRRQTYVVNRSSSVAIWVICFLVVCEMFSIYFKVPLSSTLAFGGVGGLALGLSARDIAANFLGGMLLLFNEPFTPGDMVKFRSGGGELVGRVERVGWGQTRIRGRDTRPTYIPNSHFVQTAVTNMERITHRKFQGVVPLRFQDAPIMSSVIDRIKERLMTIHKLDRLSQPFRVSFIKVGSYSLDVEIICYFSTKSLDEFLELQQRANIEIIAAIHECGADLALPTTLIQSEANRVNNDTKNSESAVVEPDNTVSNPPETIYDQVLAAEESVDQVVDQVVVTEVKTVSNSMPLDDVKAFEHTEHTHGAGANSDNRWRINISEKINLKKQVRNALIRAEMAGPKISFTPAATALWKELLAARPEAVTSALESLRKSESNFTKSRSKRRDGTSRSPTFRDVDSGSDSFAGSEGDGPMDENENANLSVDEGFLPPTEYYAEGSSMVEASGVDDNDDNDDNNKWRQTTAPMGSSSSSPQTPFDGFEENYFRYRRDSEAAEAEKPKPPDSAPLAERRAWQKQALAQAQAQQEQEAEAENNYNLVGEEGDVKAEAQQDGDGGKYFGEESSNNEEFSNEEEFSGYSPFSPSSPFSLQQLVDNTKEDRDRDRDRLRSTSDLDGYFVKSNTDTSNSNKYASNDVNMSANDSGSGSGSGSSQEPQSFDVMGEDIWSSSIRDAGISTNAGRNMLQDEHMNAKGRRSRRSSSADLYATYDGGDDGFGSSSRRNRSSSNSSNSNEDDDNDVYSNNNGAGRKPEEPVDVDLIDDRYRDRVGSRWDIEESRDRVESRWDEAEYVDSWRNGVVEVYPVEGEAGGFRPRIVEDSPSDTDTYSS